MLFYVELFVYKTKTSSVALDTKTSLLNDLESYKINYYISVYTLMFNVIIS